MNVTEFYEDMRRTLYRTRTGYKMFVEFSKSVRGNWEKQG